MNHYINSYYLLGDLQRGAESPLLLLLTERTLESGGRVTWICLHICLIRQEASSVLRILWFLPVIDAIEDGETPSEEKPQLICSWKSHLALPEPRVPCWRQIWLLLLCSLSRKLLVKCLGRPSKLTGTTLPGSIKYYYATRPAIGSRE